MKAGRCRSAAGAVVVGQTQRGEGHLAEDGAGGQRGGGGAWQGEGGHAFKNK